MSTTRVEVEAVIGLEIHAQLQTRTKIFCGCATNFGAAPNTNVCPVCLGLPGALPVLNGRVVELATRAALALGCRVHATSIFARKNYFYPDLPKGYQISQFERPLATEGRVAFPAAGIDVRITRVHLEEDAGKSLHDGFPDSPHKSHVDFNRSGVPLIEIVTEPDLRSAADAARFFELLREILVAIEVNDGNMEEGSLRCDANVSVRPRGATKLGVKTEIKNLNSFRFLQRALDHEIARQAEAVGRGEGVRQETRLWDTAASRTVSMRSKEEAHDYRYLPEPDLPPVQLSDAMIAEIRARLPELPEAQRERLMHQYGLSRAEAAQLTQSRPGVAAYFEDLAAATGDARTALNWLTGEVARKMNELGVTDARGLRAAITPEALAGLLGLVARGAISVATAKTVFDAMYGSGRAAQEIVAAEELAQIEDDATLASLVEQTLASHPGPVAQYQAGKTAALGFLVGQVMRASGGKANPRRVNALLRDALER